MIWTDDQHRHIFKSGKHADEFVIDVADADPGYIEWLLNQDWLDNRSRSILEGL